MELQALLVLCGVGVAGLAMLLLMGLFSTSGTSYEEAIAQQRRATTELLALAENKNKPKKKEKKAHKKLAKKEKTKEPSSPLTGSELESEAPAESGVDDDSVPAAKGHVEFSPTLVDVPKDTPPNVKIRKRGKDPKVKPILTNKEDPSCISDLNTVPETATTATNHFEEMHPKDELELMHSSLTTEKVTEKNEEVVEKKEKPAKPAKASKQAPKATTPAVEVVKEEVTRERHNSGDGPKEQRKGKKTEKKAPVEEVVEVVREEIVPPLNAPQPSELTTEKLLKQALAAVPPPPAPTVVAASPPGGKNKKKKAELNVLSLMAGDSSGVNVAELVRVVREAALSRNEIQILTDALLNKHHDPLPEHSEWSEGPNDPMQKLKKQLADKEKALAEEVEASQALSAKLKELRGQLNAERTRVLSTARAGEQAVAAARAEAHAVQSRQQMLIEDNKQLAQEKIMLQTKIASDNETHGQMEIHIQRLSESEQNLLAQLASVQSQLSAVALDAGQLRMEGDALRDSLCHAQAHAADLAQQLGEQQRLAAAHDLHQANERLAAVTDLQNEVQRLASRAQTAEGNLDKLKEESEKKKQQLSNELATLGEQLSARETELAELKQLKAVPAQNGLPANDQVKSAELAKVESVVEALRGELSGAQSVASELRDNVAQLQAQLVTYQDKNNELRTKNWKVMEALQTAEKALQTNAARALPAQECQQSLSEAIAKAQEAQYKEVAQVLRWACPDSAPEGGVADRAWLQAFADNLRDELEAARRDPGRELGEKQVMELALQNQQSQALIDKYQGVIFTTEKELSRLQHVMALQEKEWAQKLADKQGELDDVTQQSVSRCELEKAQETQYIEVAKVLRGACPSAAPSTAADSSWLHTFAENLKEELAKTSEPANSTSTEDRVREVQLRYEQQSVALVEKYKSIILSTEEALSRLQQTVTLQEQKWAEQLSDKQRELDELRQHTALQMQNKIDSLQEELHQSKASNHNHTFADAERLAEERLMEASISDKHNIDVCNGPLQMGLEEK